MAIEMTITTTKPADKEWWWNLNPTKMTAIDDYMRAQTGFVSYASEMQGENTRIQKLAFQTAEQVQTWRDTLYSTCAEAKERRKYNDSNGIVTVVTVATI
jgi:hypothetical protein